MDNKYLEIVPEVMKEIRDSKPVVALESTIISHGMPYPKNVEVALEVERIVRENGATPATIGIIEGKLKVGLNRSEMEILGQGKGVVKVSRRDIPFVTQKKLSGGTTVAGTMIIAAMAGIQVFATGGIGGVHRGAQDTFDISADLMELSRTNVAVVCAGVKVILDIALTLEYLETGGVPVIGYKTDEFPAFYSRTSGHKVDYRFDSMKDLAQAIGSKWDMKIAGGVIVANPIPKEFEMDTQMMNSTIAQALDEALEHGITGKEVTPYLLSKIATLSSGKSLDSNIQLVFNNAKVASTLASAISKRVKL